jgi:hypothetical protein
MVTRRPDVGGGRGDRCGIADPENLFVTGRAVLTSWPIGSDRPRRGDAEAGHQLDQHALHCGRVLCPLLDEENAGRIRRAIGHARP